MTEVTQSEVNGGSKCNFSNCVFAFSKYLFLKRKLEMPKVIQEVILLLEAYDDAPVNSFKGGNMAFNRFCIEEETGFESSGVFRLRKCRREVDLAKGEGTFNGSF